MNPSPAAIQWICEQSPDWQQSDAALADALNGVLVPNPAPAPLVPVHTTAVTLLPLLSQESLGKLEAANLLTTINAAIGFGRMWEVGNWVQYGVFRGHISPEEAEALAQALALTHPDPSHPAQVPQTLLAIGRLLDADDLAAARQETP